MTIWKKRAGSSNDTDDDDEDEEDHDEEEEEESCYWIVRNGGETANLSRQDVTDQDSRHVARALREPDAVVRELILSNNMFYDDGATDDCTSSTLQYVGSNVGP